MRLRRTRLPLMSVALIVFFGLVSVALVFEFTSLFNGPVDWLLVVVMGISLVLFVGMALAVAFLDFEQDLRLTRQGIHIIPAVFNAYLIPWDDIEKLEIRESEGFRAIEYRLKPGSPSYQARVGKRNGKKLLATESRTGGFHGAIPAQNFHAHHLPVKAEQDVLKVNKLFPTLFRYWTNPETRRELPEV